MIRHTQVGHGEGDQEPHLGRSCFSHNRRCQPRTATDQLGCTLIFRAKKNVRSCQLTDLRDEFHNCDRRAAAVNLQAEKPLRFPRCRYFTRRQGNTVSHWIYLCSTAADTDVCRDGLECAKQPVDKVLKHASRIQDKL
jgi:hypothetical protein